MPLSRRGAQEAAAPGTLGLAVVGVLAWSLLVALVGGARTADVLLFTRAGQQLLSPDGLAVFDDPALQVGPVYLAVVGAGARAAPVLQLSPVTGGLLAAGWALVVVAVLLASRALATATAPAPAGLLLHLLLGGAGSVALVAGHVEDLLAIVLVAAAGWLVHVRSPVLAGAVAGTACCVKLWALLALAALLCAPRVVDRLRATAVAGGVIALLYLPFLVQARTAGLVWHVGPPSTVSLVLASGTQVTWVGRALQLAAGCLLVVLLLRGAGWDARALWAVPAAVACARLAFEPHVLDYYWCAAAVPVGLWAWSARKSVVVAAARASAGTLLLLVLTNVEGQVGSVLTAGAVLGACAAVRSSLRGAAPALASTG